VSYRCAVCKCHVGPGKQRLVHVVKRTDGQIDREIPVCEICQEALRRDPPPVAAAKPPATNPYLVTPKPARAFTFAR
jgi:hypothetical protein